MARNGEGHLRPASRLLRGVVLLALLLVVSLAAQTAAPARVVAIGDVHGAFSELVTILQRVALVDGTRHWTGGPATLVQLGDILDRGPQARECLDLVMDLEPQAAKAGGALIPLLGNHEAMNVMGDVRYVTPLIYHEFQTGRSEIVRQQAYQDYLRFVAAHAGHGHATVAPDEEAGRKKWMDAHPPGYFEYRDAFAPGGRYGHWIRRHHALVQIGDVVFVHGGLDPALEFGSLAELDRKVGAELAAFDRLWQALVQKKVVWRYMELAAAIQHVGEELKWLQAQGTPADPDAVQDMETLLGYRQWMAAASNGPLWYRGLAQNPEEPLADGVTAMLARLHARYIVIGHTVQSNSNVTPRFANRVFAIDTGMLDEVFKGRASALEIRDGRFTVFYPTGLPQIIGGDPPK